MPSSDQDKRYCAADGSDASAVTPVSDDAASPAADRPAPNTRSVPRHSPDLPTEIGGPSGLEPTRYGDWERNGRCTDF